MRPTRRGVAVAVVCALGFVLAYGFGARALNAVILPGLVALVAAAVQVRRLDRPRVVREPPPSGFPGETHEVRLAFEGVDRAYPAVASESVDRGLSIARPHEERERSEPADRPERRDVELGEITVGGGSVGYEVTYESRGTWRLGPLSLVGRDVLGLFQTRVDTGETIEATVYPPVRGLTERARAEVVGRSAEPLASDRSEFEGLREYVSGDSLRDIHWKSTAKRDALVIAEFGDEVDESAVTIAASTAASGGSEPPTRAKASRAADAMAEAVASIALPLLAEGASVTVSLPDGELTVGPGEDGRVALLERLARVGPGRSGAKDADIFVRAGFDETRVTLRGRKRSFSELCGGSETTVAPSGGASR